MLKHVTWHCGRCCSMVGTIPPIIWYTLQHPLNVIICIQQHTVCFSGEQQLFSKMLVRTCVLCTDSCHKPGGQKLRCQYYSNVGSDSISWQSKCPVCCQALCYCFGCSQPCNYQFFTTQCAVALLMLLLVECTLLCYCLVEQMSN